MSAAKRNSGCFWAMITFLLATCLAYAQPRAAAVGPNGQSQAPQMKRTDARPADTEKLTTAEVSCIRQVLLATRPVEVDKRFRACRPSASLRMAYAYTQIKFNAPHADDEVIKAIPNSLAAMRQLYSFSGTYVVASHAYEDYYNHLFLLGKRRPQLLPTLFAIAAQYGTDNPNVDEESWFCDELAGLYRSNPEAYMQAVKVTKHPFYRRVALDCRSGAKP